VLTAVALGVAVGLVIGGLGGGGGVLAVPALVYVLGQPVPAATTGSAVIVGVTSAVGVLVRCRGGTIDWRTGFALAATGVPAAIAGTLLGHRVAEGVLLLAFAGLSAVAAAALLLDGRVARVAVEHRPRALVVAGCGAAVGFLTGFLGVGGGFLVVPVLTLVLHLPMRRAVGTSLLVITLNSAAALSTRVVAPPELDWRVLCTFTVAAVVSALVAGRVADRLSGAALTRAFAGMLLAVSLAVGAQSVLAFAGQ
jgi:uncharacterized protein